MNRSPLSEEHDDENLYTIGTVSNLTGVGAITLRAWERRYELIHPVRKQSGHRLYTRKHIDQINRITALTSQGLRISQIRPEMLNSVEVAADEQAQGQNKWHQYKDSLIAAVVSFDEIRMEQIYNDVLSLYPIELVTRKLLQPLLVELGLRWETHLGSVAEEHFFAFYLRNKLGARYHHRSHSNTGPRLLLAGLPGELHEISMLLFCLSASESGFQLITLGANMPLDELAQASRKARADALVLCGFMQPEKTRFAKELSRLVANCGVPVFIGGQASITACDAIESSGAIALGNDLDFGLRRMARSLSDSIKAT